MRVCDAAVAVLRETGNPAVMYGDSGLLDQIAERANQKGHEAAHPTLRWKRVLDALTKQPGELVPGLTATPDDRYRMRVFWLPEHAPRSTDAAR